MPGLTLRIRFSASEYMRHSRKQFGRGPTRLMLPARTLRSWGNSLRFVCRMTCPTRVMRGSFAAVDQIADTACSRSFPDLGGNNAATPDTPSASARNALNRITFRFLPLPRDCLTGESLRDPNVLQYVFARPTSSQYSYSVIVRGDVHRVLVQLARFAVCCHPVGRSANTCRCPPYCTKFALVGSHDAARSSCSRCVFDRCGLSCQQTARLTLVCVWYRRWDRSGRAPHSLN